MPLSTACKKFLCIFKTTDYADEHRFCTDSVTAKSNKQRYLINFAELPFKNGCLICVICGKKNLIHSVILPCKLSKF